ncbi:hypothetical protein HUK80_04885 [Flavobacterium sp. MAH-1]|uniref:Fibronectin type-III domain-containing protein n=1 Tax=Flavobacterium agri TaxID=2743471 RepID=A0A7Y9C6I0_9FLAO|nr:hypothetical protein [Flavobacterium agri]NUY80222.1 hypothetical protein [Flavobacterium agri]NYA70247.1 hypothetical protein [Flavobacterium agri]
MRKIFTLLFVAVALLQGCSGGDEGSSCSKIDSFSVTSQLDKLHFNIVAEGDAGFYEISFGPSDQAYPGGGYTTTTQATTGDLDLEEFTDFSNGSTITIYARAVCPDGSKSKWTPGVTVSINDYCRRPDNINYTLELSWDNRNWGENVSQYQIKYGESGFTGNGTVFTTNNTFYDGIPMAAQTSYDFYVRANCGGSSWSSWEGPYTYFSQTNQNMCLQPSNVSYTIEYTNGSLWGANFSYNGNGEDQFEYALMTGTAAPTNAQLSTISSGFTPTYTGLNVNTTYKFWIRGICDDGSRTAWSTIMVTH